MRQFIKYAFHFIVFKKFRGVFLGVPPILRRKIAGLGSGLPAGIGRLSVSIFLLVPHKKDFHCNGEALSGSTLLNKKRPLIPNAKYLSKKIGKNLYLYLIDKTLSLYYLCLAVV
jgi:hypothetical protein